MICPGPHGEVQQTGFEPSHRVKESVLFCSLALP